jgi:hypothetical protein
MTVAIDPGMYPRLIAQAVQAHDRDSLCWYRVQASEQMATFEARRDDVQVRQWRAVRLAAVKGLVQVTKGEVRA